LPKSVTIFFYAARQIDHGEIARNIDPSNAD